MAVLGGRLAVESPGRRGRRACSPPCPRARGLIDDELRTARLVLRPFRRADLPAFTAYRADPAVARYQELGGRLLGGRRGGLPPPRWRASRWGHPGRVDAAGGGRASTAARSATAPSSAARPAGHGGGGVTLAPATRAADWPPRRSARPGRLFGRRGLHRVFARRTTASPAVHRLLERLGFRCEARHVEADWFKGEWTTLRVYACSRADGAARARELMRPRLAATRSHGPRVASNRPRPGMLLFNREFTAAAAVRAADGRIRR